MGNYVFADIYMKGEKKNLEKLHEAMLTLTDERKRIRIEDLTEYLELEYEADTNYLIDDFDFEEDGSYYLHAELKNDDHRFLWCCIASKIGLSYNSWSGAFSSGDGCWTIDNLSILNYGYSLEVTTSKNDLNLSSDFSYFENSKQLEDYLNENSGKDLSLEEWKTFLEKTGIAYINEVDEDYL